MPGCQPGGGDLVAASLAQNAAPGEHPPSAQGGRGTKCGVLGRGRSVKEVSQGVCEYLTPPKVLRRRNASRGFCSSPDCIKKIMMSHLTLHPKSEANYLCLYWLMMETLTGPLLPAGSKTNLSQGGSFMPVCLPLD